MISSYSILFSCANDSWRTSEEVSARCVWFEPSGRPAAVIFPLTVLSMTLLALKSPCVPCFQDVGSFNAARLLWVYRFANRFLLKVSCYSNLDVLGCPKAGKRYSSDYARHLIGLLPNLESKMEPKVGLFIWHPLRESVLLVAVTLSCLGDLNVSIVSCEFSF